VTGDPEVPIDDEIPSFVDHHQLADELRLVEAPGGGPDEPSTAGGSGDPHVADALLLDRLIASGLRGAEYNAFILELTKYGLAVMTAWTMDGTAFTRAWKLGRPVAAANRPAPGRTSRDDAVAIADLTVTLGLQLFDKAVLRQRTWQPERGASIKTFFIGGCLLKLSNACRTWRADTPVYEFPTGEALPIPEQRQPSDPQDIVVVQAMIDEAIGPEPERVKRMLVMARDGYTHREIAEALCDGTTERGVEGELHRARRRARLRLQGGDNGADHPGVC
jgi:DNA-directed RNA polymerase specialized sigma24 family protein